MQKKNKIGVRGNPKRRGHLTPTNVRASLVGCASAVFVWTVLNFLCSTPARQARTQQQLMHNSHIQHVTPKHVTSATHTAKAAPPNLLLTVPFYVYSSFQWENATLLGDPYWDTKKDKGVCEDIWFLHSAMRHPMRTMDPKRAKLFIIPILLDGLDDTINEQEESRSFCAYIEGTKYCRKELLRVTNEIMKRCKIFQEYFHKYPERHMVVQSHWASMFRVYKVTHLPEPMDSYLREMNAMVFERGITWIEQLAVPPNNDNRMRFPTFYVGEGCPKADTVQKTTDIAFVGSLYTRDDDDNGNKSPNAVKHFSSRRIACEILLDYQKGGGDIVMDVCGQGTPCPAMAQARLGFHFRGDTLSSQRLINLIMSGTIPIITHKEQYDLLPPWIDWRKFTYFVDFGANKTRPELLKDMLAIIEESRERGGLYDAKYKEMIENRDLLDWKKTLYPFDTYMYMLQAYLFPNTRHPKSQWSTLFMPEVGSESFVMHRTVGGYVKSTGAVKPAWD